MGDVMFIVISTGVYFPLPQRIVKQKASIVESKQNNNIDTEELY